MGLSDQLDEVEKIDIDVRTNLLKMVQGQTDSVSITGQGLVMQKDVRVQEMELHIDSIDINPLSAIFGQIELNQPTDATVRIVLTEKDINRALNSDYIRSKLQNLELDVEGKTAVIEPQHLELYLPGSGKMVFIAEILLQDEIGMTKQLGITAKLLVKTGEQPLLLEGFACTPGQGISLELAITFMRKVRELVNLPYYEIEGMTLLVKDIEVQEGRITVQAESHVVQIPFS